MVKGKRKGGRAVRAFESGPKKQLSQAELRDKLSSNISTPSRITDFFETNRNTTSNSHRNSNAVYILQQADNIIKKSPHRIEISENTCEDADGTKKPKTVKTQKLTDYFPVRRSVRKTKKTVLEEKQKDIENAVLSGNEEGLEVHIFQGKGRGVIATRAFRRGDFVVEYAGELITSEEAKIRESIYSQDQNTGCYMYYFMHKGKQYCVDATAESPRLGRLVNHSRNGNLMTKTVCVGLEPRLILIARDDIRPGDELSYDYGDRSKESLRHHPWLAS